MNNSDHHSIIKPLLHRTLFIRTLAFIWLCLLIGLLYGRAISFDFTRTDDTRLITERETFITNLSNLPSAFSQTFFINKPRGEGYYRPLVTTSLMIDAQWNGTNPAVFHITNIILHIVACWLLFLLLRRLHFKPLSSIIAASVFAVHPVNTEAVCWIPGRADILMTIFSISSILFFLKYLESKNRLVLAAHMLLFFCALLTKEAAAFLPLLCISYAFSQQGIRKTLRDIHIFPGWAVCIGLWIFLWTKMVMGITSELRGWIDTFFENIPLIWIHLGKIIYPSHLSVLAVPIDTPSLPGIICLFGIFTITVIWYARTLKNTESSARQQFNLFALGLLWYLFFVLPTLPASNFMILENRLYLPAIGIIMSILALVDFIITEYSKMPIRTIFALVSASILTLFGFMSYQFSPSFRNAETFTENAVKNSPHCALAHLNRGVLYHREKRYDEAEQCYLKSKELNSNQPNLSSNLGEIYMRRREYARAEELFRTETEVNPYSYLGYYNLGLSLKMQSRESEAITAFHRAIQLDPKQVKSLMDALITYYDQNDNHAKADWYRELTTAQ